MYSLLFLTAHSSMLCLLVIALSRGSMVFKKSEGCCLIMRVEPKVINMHHPKYMYLVA